VDVLVPATTDWTPLIARAVMSLAEAESVVEASEIRNRAEALRAYVRQAGEGLELQNQFAELKLRAERRAGELLANLDLRTGPKPVADTLSGMGVAAHQSSRWQAIASIPEIDFEVLISETFYDGRELTSAAALLLAKRLAVSMRPAARLHVANGSQTETTGFATIVLDPPWAYESSTIRGAAANHYPAMSIEELAKLEIPAADDAHLYCWVTNGFVRDGFDLLDAWGFEYKTMLTWVKPHMGVGKWFRSATEHVLFAVRGHLPTQRRDVINWFEAPRGKHSEKPDCFFSIVEATSPGPFLEMFARRRRAGWSSWGNECRP
jgi:N6-adenosine-specific RNA methylase IME4